MVSATNDSHKSAEAMAPSDIYIDAEKEKAIIRKFDYLVLPQFVIILVLAYLDRSNIGTPPFGSSRNANIQLT